MEEREKGGYVSGRSLRLLGTKEERRERVNDKAGITYYSPRGVTEGKGKREREEGKDMFTSVGG